MDYITIKKYAIEWCDSLSKDDAVGIMGKITDYVSTIRNMHERLVACGFQYNVNRVVYEDLVRILVDLHDMLEFKFFSDAEPRILANRERVQLLDLNAEW